MWLESLFQDMRFAWRTLKKNPTLTFVAVASLAIGIGANTAIFSLVDAILLKSLPVRDPQQLRLVLWTGKSRIPVHRSSGYTITLHGVEVHGQFPYPIYKLLVASVPQFSDLMCFALSQVTVVSAGESHYGIGLFVTGNFFDGLGVKPVLGRMLSPEDDRVSSPPVVVLNYQYWERRFGLDPNIVGRNITINGHPVTVVGITPRPFLGTLPGLRDDLFLPIAHVGIFSNGEYEVGKDDSWWVETLGRLRPGVSDRQASAALDVVMARAAASYPEAPDQRRDPFHVVLEAGSSGVPELREQTVPPLLILMSVVGLVLLIACVNIANLLLARGVARRREMAVRLAIGAGRKRLVRQLLTESLLVAMLGAAAGLSFASPLAKAIRALAAGNEPLTIDAQLDTRALLFTAGIAVLTALIFGLVPAFRATRIDLTPALKDALVFGAGGRPRLNGFLVVGQVALSTLLLAGAGLFIRTLENLSSLNPGFEARRLLIFTVDGSRSGYSGRKLTDLYERIRTRVAATPGVQAVTLSSVTLIGNSMSSSSINIPGYTPKPGHGPETWHMTVGSGFLTTMRMQILLGRDIGDRDLPNATKAAVVNETFVRKYLAGQNPLGATFYFGDAENPRPQDLICVVGVSKDAKYDNLRHEIEPTAYLPYVQNPDQVRQMTFEVRTALPPFSIAGAVQRAVASIDRNVPVADMRTQEEQIKMSLGMERAFAALVGCFGVIAALLAAIGLYGVMAYAVSRRTLEIGIRMALGAGRNDIRRMVLRDSLVMVAVGIALGIPSALVLTRLVRHALYGIPPTDPVSFVAAGVLMSAIAGLAAWIPARRAAALDLMFSLRHE
jgi:predicted permease